MRIARTGHSHTPGDSSSENTRFLTRSVSDANGSDRIAMSHKNIREHVQLTLDDARKPTGRGGWRPRAGRPRGRRNVTHDRRHSVAERIPQHVTMRVAADLPSLRHPRFVGAVRESIA